MKRTLEVITTFLGLAAAIEAAMPIIDALDEKAMRHFELWIIISAVLLLSCAISVVVGLVNGARDSRELSKSLVTVFCSFQIHTKTSAYSNGMCVASGNQELVGNPVVLIAFNRVLTYIRKTTPELANILEGKTKTEERGDNGPD